MRPRRLFPVLLVWAVAGCSSPTPPVLTTAPVTIAPSDASTTDPSPPAPKDLAGRTKASKPTPPSTTATIQKCHDGDTCTTTTGEIIRILGINAPELHPVQCFGAEAAKAMQGHLTGQTVTLQADPTQGDRDHYSRSLRYIATGDGQDVSEWLLLGGYAHVYNEYPVTKTPLYRTDQATAQAAHTGGWAPTPQGCGWTK